MQYTIPPFGPLWTDGVFTVPTCVADRYLKLASAYQLQALLLLLRHGGSLSTRELAGALGIPERDADSIMDFWVAEGLLQSGNSPAAPAPAGEQRRHRRPHLPLPAAARILRRCRHRPESRAPVGMRCVQTRLPV